MQAICRLITTLLIYFTYDDADVIGISQVFNIPESDAKKIYDNFYTIIKGEA